MVQDFQTFGGLLIFVSADENTVGLMLSSSDTSAELMELRKANRSAFSTIITVAFGTLTPTSTTVVETSTWISPLANRSMISFFCAASSVRAASLL